MVMECLDGVDLGAWVQQRGPLGIEQAVDFILQASEAIAEAHALGIVHRDLKPANLFCIRAADGLLSIKVLDFGISKITGAADLQITREDSVFGSPLYMSPEQLLSAGDVDARTDIWSLGAILYELLTGKPPFNSDKLPEVYARIAAQPAPPLRIRRPDAPAGIESVILKCLEKDRHHRYQHLAEFGVALSEFAPKRAHASVERISRLVRGQD